MAVVQAPLIDLLREEAIVGSDVRHGDNTTVPILALGSGKTKTGALLGLCARRASSQCDASAGVCVFRLAGPEGKPPHSWRSPACCKRMPRLALIGSAGRRALAAG